MEKRRKQVLAASFLAGAFAVTAGFAVQGHARAAQYRRMLDNTYQHAFTELATAAGEHEIPGLGIEEADVLRDRAAELARLAREDV